MGKTTQALTAAVLTTLVGLATMLFSALAGAAPANDVAQRVGNATYQLYIRISPPGRTVTRSVAFCSTSFYLRDVTPTEEPEFSWQDPVGREPGYYGTTAGHCLDAYGVIRDRFKQRWWGLEFELAVAQDKSRNRFIPIEAVSNGFEQWRDWKSADDDRREYMTRPSPDDVDDWGIVKAGPDAGLNTIRLAARGVSAGDTVYMAGFPFALGQTWSAGTARPDYRLPGTLFDHYIATAYTSQPGTSGSPVVNEAGHQVGINVAGFPGGPSIATPIGRVDFPAEETVDSDDEQGETPRGFMYHALPMPDRMSFPARLDEVENRIARFVERYAPEQGSD